MWAASRLHACAAALVLFVSASAAGQPPSAATALFGKLSPGRTPAEIAWLMQQFLKPFRYESVISEAENHYSTDVVMSIDDREEEQAARSFGNRPVIVLTAGTDQFGPDVTNKMKKAFDIYWKAGHDRLAARSTRGRSIVVGQTTHFIQLDQPQAVIGAIRTVVAEVRTRPEH
jgi:hypothetical protein